MLAYLTNQGFPRSLDFLAVLRIAVNTGLHLRVLYKRDNFDQKKVSRLGLTIARFMGSDSQGIAGIVCSLKFDSAIRKDVEDITQCTA